jgi:hypothetical protein
VTIDLGTTNESFEVVPIDLSGLKDFRGFASEFQQMVTVRQGLQVQSSGAGITKNGS